MPMDAITQARIAALRTQIAKANAEILKQQIDVARLEADIAKIVAFHHSPVTHQFMAWVQERRLVYRDEIIAKLTELGLTGKILQRFETHTMYRWVPEEVEAVLAETV